MKSLMPWFCVIATAGMQAAFANGGVDAYRQGEYAKSAQKLISDSDNKLADYYLGRMRIYGYGVLKNNKLALDYFERSAAKGYLDAQNIMARYELLQNRNPERALHWFKKAADAGDTQAQMYCAAAYMFGFGVKKNPSMARKYYIAAAKSDNAIAQYTLAEYFLASRNSHNRKLGLIWLSKAVEKGDVNALLKQGELYRDGKFVDQNEAKAKELLAAAVAQGSVPALYQMGLLELGDHNTAAAKDWFVKAADKQYIPAQLSLAKLFLDKEGGAYDPQAGFLWMLKAAQGHSKEAQRALAKMYREGAVISKDENLAKEWEAKAAEKEKSIAPKTKEEVLAWLSNGKAINFVQSGYRLKGIFSAWKNANALKQNNYNQPPQMNEVGRETLFKPAFNLMNPNDIAISDYYDALAVSLGEGSSSVDEFPAYKLENLNQYKSDKSLLPQSPLRSSAEMAGTLQPIIAQSFDVFKLIDSTLNEENEDSAYKSIFGHAILGNSNAQFTLAQMHQYGIAANQNMQKAIQFYEMAANQEDLRAIYNLGLIYLQGTGGITPDYQKAEEWLEDAAFKGNPNAQYVLARIKEKGFHNGQGELVIEPDKDESIAMYYIASSNDHGLAQYRLAELLVRERPNDVSVAAQQQRHELIKKLYQGALTAGVSKASLPLAFFNATESDPAKQVQAFKVAKTQADAGNPKAALLLGLLLDRGIGVEKNPIDAIYWYQKSTLNPVSSFILGTYKIQGNHIDQDAKGGKALLQQSANGGFAFGNLNLAVAKQQQGERFISELDAARAKGNSTAGLLLADYYLSLGDSQENMEQARDIYRHFAEKGDKKAQLKLGFMYQQGLGGNLDDEKAQQWYLSSAKQGQPEAQYLLGRLYQLGWIGLSPDYQEAKKWYSKAQSVFAPAAVALGFIYETVDDDYANALKSYKIAANLQDAIGQLNEGLVYEYGKGCNVDFARAKALFVQAAQAGLDSAMVQLAGLYFNGQGGERDPQKALNWYKKAAEKGNREALYQLGLFSETGVAVQMNYQEALRYYQQAAAKGNAKAMLALARMNQYGQGIPKDYTKALKWYKALADLDNPYAQYQLATIYYEGLTGERRPEEGKKLLLKAEANGSQQARKALQWIEAQSKERLSYIEPVTMLKRSSLAGQSADLMYLDAMNEWNRGDEESSIMILDRILTQFPHYTPAKRAYERLHQPFSPKTFS